jgi:hypothetical protein
MVLRLLCLAIASTLISSATVCAQKDVWTQLVPLESSREDVERVLGKPMKYFKAYGIYKEIPDVVIDVWYSTGKCTKTVKGAPLYDVREGVMTRLYVTFPKRRKLRDMQSDIAKFTRKQFEELAGRAYYYSPDNSLVYTVFVEKDESETVYSVSVQPGDDKEGQKCRTLEIESHGSR